MNEKMIKTSLHKSAEEFIPSEQVDLWPAIRERLVAKQHPLFTQGAVMNRSTLSHRRVSLAAMALVFTLILAALVATPRGRAFAQEIRQFFFRTESSTVVLPTVSAEFEPASTNAIVALPAVSAPAEQPGCGSMIAPRCTLDEVRVQVAFPVKDLRDVPGGLRFVGAIPYQDGVLLTYAGAGTLIFTQTPLAQDDLLEWQVGPDADVAVVWVGSQPGEYVQGGWVGLGDEEAGAVQWDPDFPTQTLRWTAEGIQYTLVFFPAQTPDGPASLDKAQLVALAAEIQPAIESTSAATLTLRQVADQAGFSVQEPGWLPAGFALSRVSYDSQHNAVCLYYQAAPDDIYPSLVVAQSAWALPELKDIQSVAMYGDQVVEIASTVEMVPVAGANGDQATLVSTGLEVNKYCGGELLPANRALMWQSGLRTHLIFARIDGFDGRSFVTRLEMARLAEALNGVEVTASMADPERLLSISEAEALAGFDLKVPGRMLAGLRFDHIALIGQESGPLGGLSERAIGLLYTGQPVGDGRRYNIFIAQIPNSPGSLEVRALAGGFETVGIRQQPAIYQEQCWDGPAVTGGTGCMQTLIWFEGSTEYEILAYFPARVPRANIISIAESLR